MKKVSIAVILDKNDNVLMGKRNDTSLWTNPAGSSEGNEDPEQTCKRELLEETGLSPESLELVRSKYIEKKDIMLYLFLVKIKDIKDLDISKDPDKEFKEIDFVDPLNIINNLQVPAKENIAIEWWANNKI